MARFILALQVVAYNRTTSKVDDFLNNEVSRTLSRLSLHHIHKDVEKVPATYDRKLIFVCHRPRAQTWLVPTPWRRWWGS